MSLASEQVNSKGGVPIRSSAAWQQAFSPWLREELTVNPITCAAIQSTAIMPGRSPLWNFVSGQYPLLCSWVGHTCTLSSQRLNRPACWAMTWSAFHFSYGFNKSGAECSICWQWISARLLFTARNAYSSWPYNCVCPSSWQSGENSVQTMSEQ